MESLELRVLEGRQSGARSPLEVGKSCLLAVGAADAAEAAEADLMLRDELASVVRIRITPGFPNAIVEVLAGSVLLGEQTLAAGSEGIWTSPLPLRIGAVAVAFGKAAAPDWDPQVAWDAATARHEPSDSPVDADAQTASTAHAKQSNPARNAFAARIARAQRNARTRRDSREGRSGSDAPAGHESLGSDASGDAGDAVAASDRRGLARKNRRTRPELWLAALGTLAAVVCATTLWLARAPAVAAPVTALVAADSGPVEQLGEALRENGFGSLNVAQDPLGRLSVSGRLDTLAARGRLDAWLAERKLSPIVQVHVDEAVIRDVTAVFRVNNVAVQVRSAGAGRVTVQAAESDPAVLARAEEAVRRDVRGLVALSVENRAAPKPAPAAPVFDDPNKRIASVVVGNPAYLVTVDGARYFEGALLPSGHRITTIAAQQVTVERDGQPIILNF